MPSMWPVTMWPPETIGHAQRALEVHLRALPGAGKGGLRKRLLADVGDERASGEVGDRQTRAIHGNGVAKRHVSAKLRCVDLELRTARNAVGAHHDSLGFDQSCEHAR